MDGKATRPVDWKARAGVTGKLGLAGTALLVLAGGLALAFLLRAPVSLTSLILLVLGLVGLGGALLVGVLTYGLYSLRYRLGSGSLVVDWLGQQESIPYGDIDALYGGHRLGRFRGPRLLDVRGYRVGPGSAKGIGVVRFYTTSEQADDIAVIATSGAAYALTPDDPQGFRRALIAHLEAGVSDPAPTLVHRSWRRLLALADGVAAASLAASTVLLLAAVGVIVDRYAMLPEQIPLYLDSAGQALLTGPRAGLFWLPGIGALLMVGNALLGSLVASSELVLARLLWLASPVVQALLLISVLRLTVA